MTGPSTAASEFVSGISHQQSGTRFRKSVTKGERVSSRRVLILTYHFPPSAASGSFRMLGFARHLPGHGWESVVVAPPRLPWEPVDPDLTGRVPRGTVIYPVPYTRSKVVR